MSATIYVGAKIHMQDISLKELLEAGCHFGHQVTRQNPKAREFIFQAREGVHIIDLAKTREGLLAAADFIRSVSAKGGTMLLLGTKRQARSIIEDSAKKTGAYAITNRWVGGTLTNFDEVGKNYKKLKDLQDKLQSDEEKAKYTKKEVGMWDKERVKLERFYAGIYTMAKLPDVIFIIDTHKEDLAVKEAKRMGIPVVGIVDTNADPTAVTYPIPANDDAVGSIELIANFITDAWVEGQKQAAKGQEAATEDKTKEEKGVETAKTEKKEAVREKVKKSAKSEKPVVKSKEEKKSTKIAKAKRK